MGSAPDRRRWMVLFAGCGALIAGCTFQYGLPYLIPGLLDDGLSLGQAGLLVSCPIAGLLLTLLAWGAAADRWGERTVLTAGLGLGGVVLLAGVTARSTVGLAACFVLAGGATAAVHAASGRLILGWFAARERGRAMAIRQAAQPLGVSVAALALPSLAAAGIWAALVFLAAACLVAALLVAVVVRDPDRPPVEVPVEVPTEVSPASAQPYRSPMLWRIHATSALLVVPQFAVATFGLVYLVEERGWLAPAAGAMFAAVGVGGAAVRLAVGYWSDRAGSRLRPLRMLTVGIGAVMLALALGTLSGSSATTAVLLVAGVITVSTNGLAFTAVAEHAGRPWAGRALGVQNTAQNAVAAATPPVLAAVIAGAGYGTAFAATVAFPLLACALVPVRAERPLGTRSRVGRHADAPRPARRRKAPAPRPRPGGQRAVVGDDPRRAGRRARGDRG